MIFFKKCCWTVTQTRYKVPYYIFMTLGLWEASKNTASDGSPADEFLCQTRNLRPLKWQQKNFGITYPCIRTVILTVVVVTYPCIRTIMVIALVVTYPYIRTVMVTVQVVTYPYIRTVMVVTYYYHHARHVKIAPDFEELHSSLTLCILCIYMTDGFFLHHIFFEMMSILELYIVRANTHWIILAGFI